jgi:uncharacterized membrane protein
MTGMRLPPQERGELLGTAERALSLSLGLLSLRTALRRRDRLGLLIGFKSAFMLRRGITGRSTLYRLLHAEPGGFSPLDKRFRVYLATTIHRPRAVVREILLDGAVMEAGCPTMVRLALHRDPARAAPRQPDWDSLLTEYSDDEAALLHIGGNGLTHNCNHLAIELRSAYGGAGTELRLLLRYRPYLGVVGRLLQGSPRVRIQRELDRLRQVMEAGVIADATGPRGPGERNLMAVTDDVAQEVLP